DGLGRVVCESLPVADGTGPCTSEEHTQYTYDTAGRLVSITTPDGLVTTYTFATPVTNNWVSHEDLDDAYPTVHQVQTTVKDGSNNVQRQSYHTYDTFGRL